MAMEPHKPIKHQLHSLTENDISALHQTLWAERPFEDVESFLGRCLHIMTKKQGGAVVATIEQRPVGFGLLAMVTTQAEISDLIVAPAWRNYGLGSSMIQYLIGQVRQLPTHRIEIGVTRSNPHALRLYQRFGFSIFKTIALDLGQGNELVDYLVINL